jgi:hypothetical protein
MRLLRIVRGHLPFYGESYSGAPPATEGKPIQEFGHEVNGNANGVQHHPRIEVALPCR